MIEMLIQIPGPIFLLYFMLLAAVCIVLAWLLGNADDSDQYCFPELTCLDPFAISALRGGVSSVILTAIFSLWSRSLVDIEKSISFWKGEETYIRSKSSQEMELSPIEKKVYRFLKSPRKPHDLLKDSRLKQRINIYMEPVNRQLEDLCLARTARDRFRIWMALIIAAGIIIMVGGTKLYFGITRNRPVVFLIILLIGSLVILFRILNPTAISTRIGRRYLKALEKHFDWVKESLQSNKIPEGVDPAFSVAVFGIGSLAGVSLYNPFSEIFPARKPTWWCPGACGGGGCGGGGCGGGGCGGGCGGCGGCGG